MLAYKGFEKGLICRGYQFEMGLNITEKANCVENGFHCAENPLDCLTYYSNIKNSEYYIPEITDVFSGIIFAAPTPKYA